MWKGSSTDDLLGRTLSLLPCRLLLLFSECQRYLASLQGSCGGSSQRAAAEREVADVARWEPPGESKEFSLDLPTGVREVLQNALELAIFQYVSAKE